MKRTGWIDKPLYSRIRALIPILKEMIKQSEMFEDQAER